MLVLHTNATRVMSVANALLCNMIHEKQLQYQNGEEQEHKRPHFQISIYMSLKIRMVQFGLAYYTLRSKEILVILYPLD